MTAAARRITRGSRLPARVQWCGVLATAAALGALIAIGQPGRAQAAGGYNQITGAGLTDSAVTVPWTHGLLDAGNKPIASANADRSSSNPTSPFSFMYSDFTKLKVTVSQTKDIAHQGITVSWTGGAPSISGGTGPQANFLQLMECYGDNAAGPSPEDCEYGSIGLLAAGIPNPYIGQRIGHICAPGSVPSVTNPPSSLDGSGPLAGCDPQEPLASANPPHVEPCTGSDCTAQGLFSIPFVPVSDPGSPVYQDGLSQAFDEFSTNEVQEAVTSADGTGQLQFETLTGTQAPGLGCGELESNGQPRNCWLVIVPRGQYEPNGYKINAASAGVSGYIQSSPLSASNWAMRMQVRLDYAPLTPFCPIGTKEVETLGTQIVSRAVQSWQLALNKAADCSKIYGYSAVPEATSTQLLSLPGSGIGLAFTTIPIGSEASRPASGSTGAAHPPPVIYAPVAVSALGFGFNIDETTGYIGTPVKLTAELLAKGLTQVYRFDLPDYYPSAAGHPGPAWSQANPVNISNDPLFEQLNPEVPAYNSAGISLAPLLTEDHSALNQQVWQWIQAGAATRGWLDGAPDPTDKVTVNPDYKALHLGKPPAIDSFPRAYAGCLDLGKFAGPPAKEETRCSLDLLPYVNDYDQAASKTLTATNPTTGQWSDVATAPDGSTGWWQKTGAEPLGQIFIWGIADTPDLAGYGLIDAQLCNDSGSKCVAPSTASVTAALSSARPDRAGLLQVNPADPGTGGYPLVEVTYAAVKLHQSAAALTSYADLIAYAAGQGQTPGVAPGNLPPGYLPLPPALRAQARAAVAKLRAAASPGLSNSPSRSQPPPGGAPQPGGSQPASTGTQATPTPAAGSSASPAAYLTSPPSGALASLKTKRQAVGTVRWVLLAVVLAGAACASGGVALRYARIPGWLNRRRS